MIFGLTKVDRNELESSGLGGGEVNACNRTTAVGAVALLALSGCGTYVPRKSLYQSNVRDEKGSYEGKMEINLVANIRCEVENAIHDVEQLGGMPYLSTTWGTQITLNLAWDEMSAVAPGLSFLSPLRAMQSFELGLGGSATAHATRRESITFLWENRQLLKEHVLYRTTNQGRSPDCARQEKGVMIDSDLRIGEFIYDKATLAKSQIGTTVGSNWPQFSTFQETLTFVGSFGGQITPTWKLTRLTADTSGDLFSATRTTTGEILITLGPLATDNDGNLLPKLGDLSFAQHIAGLTGGSVASQVRSQAR